MKNFHFKYTLKAFNSKFKMFHLISLKFPSEFRRLCIVLLISPLSCSTLHSSKLYYNPQLSCVPGSQEISIINNICMSLQSQELDFIQHLAFREANLTTRSRWETTYKFWFHGCNNRNSMGNNFLFRVSRKSLLVIWMKAFVLKFLFLPQKALSWYHIQPTIHLGGVLEMTWKSDKAKQ